VTLATWRSHERYLKARPRRAPLSSCLAGARTRLPAQRARSSGCRRTRPSRRANEAQRLHRPSLPALIRPVRPALQVVPRRRRYATNAWWRSAFHSGRHEVGVQQCVPAVGPSAARSARGRTRALSACSPPGATSAVGRVMTYPDVAGDRSIRLSHLRRLARIFQPFVALIANDGNGREPVTHDGLAV
jgi:hypothetical protein